MAKLAIIFGAGASFDFVPTYPPPDSSNSAVRDLRIPLANQLFENRAEFASIAEKLRTLPPIVPQLRHRTGNKSVEEVLEELRSMERDHLYWARRQRELMAVRFYLQKAIWWAETAMVHQARGISNYGTLLAYIEEFRRSREPVILITFNYDTLIERALSSEFNYTFKDINDYVRRDEYKLFKLHGSVNWGNPIMDDARLDIRQDEQEVINSIIDLAGNFDYEIEDFVVTGKPGVVFEKWAYLPALSIPVRMKSRFSCPKHWLPLLERSLEGVSNLLVIGWSGGEDHFLKKLVPALNKNPDLTLTVVTNNQPSASETQTRLATAGLKMNRHYFNLRGFTNFIVSDQVKIFLRRGGNVV